MNAGFVAMAAPSAALWKARGDSGSLDLNLHALSFRCLSPRLHDHFSFSHFWCAHVAMLLASASLALNANLLTAATPAVSAVDLYASFVGVSSPASLSRTMSLCRQLYLA